MQKSLDNLIALLGLEELEVNIFRGRCTEGWQRVFGGQVLAQALVAAGRTVDEGVAHSFHAYFLRPGDSAIPILYNVDRTRDGRTFTTRRVTAIQHGHAIFHLEASFQRVESGPEHQDEMPDVPDPETLPTWQERMEPLAAQPELVEKLSTEAPDRLKDWLASDRPIDIRHVTKFDPITPEELPARLQVWVRADGHLPDSTLLHQCIAAFASDMTLLETAALPHGITWSDGAHMVGRRAHGREPRPRNLVPSRVSGRRLAALRSAEPHRGRRAGLQHGADVQPRRTVGDLGGSRGSDPAHHETPLSTATRGSDPLTKAFIRREVWN